MGVFKFAVKEAARAYFAREREWVERLSVAPDDSRAALELARLYIRRGRPMNVLPCLDAPAIQLSDDIEVHREACKMLLEIGAFEPAVRQAVKGLALADHPVLAALREQALRRLAEDIACGLTPALKRTYLKAMERLTRERPAGAAELFDRVVSAAPKFVPAWIGLRGALEAQGDRVGAEAIGDRWIAADPAAAGVIRIVMARRLSPEGLILDRRAPQPFRRMRDALQEVRSLTALEAAPAGFLPLDPGGEAVTLDPVISQRPDGSDRVVLRHKTPEVFLAGLDNAALVGRGAVLDTEGAMVRELHSPSLEKYGIVDGGHQAGFDSVRFSSGLGDIRVHDTPALLLAGVTDKSFGDWMLNFVPRLAIARAAGLKCPVVVSAQAPEPFLELLRQLGLNDEDIILHDPNGVSVFRKLYVPSWPIRDFLQPMSGLFDIFRDLALPATKEPGRRLYLSRERILRRDMVNERELRETFERYGFEAVHPQEIGLKRVRELLADADYVAAPYGSALLNLAMAGRKPKVVVCMPPMLKRGFLHQTALWLGAMGLQFAYVTGHQIGELGKLGVKDAAWAAPIAEVEQMLNAIIGV